MEKQLYQYIGYIINPDIEFQRESLGGDYESVKADYDIVVNESNLFDKRVEVMKNYLFKGGAIMPIEGNKRYIIEIDDDGAYLYERLNCSMFERETEMRIETYGFWGWFDCFAEKGWKIVVAQDGKNDNRAYNIYDENDNLIGSYDSVDGWEFNSGYFE